MFDAVDGRVAVIDIDAHHGNGTQQIFYDDPGVLTGSVHVDPARRVVSPFPRLRGRDRRRAGRRRQPQRLPGPRLRRRASGSRASTSSRHGRQMAGPRRSWSPLASTPPAATPRVRSRSAQRAIVDGWPPAGRTRPADGDRPGGRLRPRDDRRPRGRLPHWLRELAGQPQTGQCWAPSRFFRRIATTACVRYG